MKNIINRFKKTAIKIALLIGMLALPVVSQAQTYSSYVQVWGTNSAPVLLHFNVQSNQTSLTFPPQTLVVTNICTNEMITVQYNPNFLGAVGTNMPMLASITTNFPASAGWTNGSTWTYPVPGGTYYFANTPWATMMISNGATGSGSWTNGVAFQ